VLDNSLIATREEVAAMAAGSAAAGRTPGVLLQRAKHAHQAALVPGTLKGAVNLEYTRWFAPDSAVMLGTDEVKKIAADPARQRRCGRRHGELLQHRPLGRHQLVCAVGSGGH
jgi:hypothetical protein